MNDNLQILINALFDSYQDESAAIHHLDRQALPSAEKIVEIIKVLQALMFPGFFGGETHNENLRLRVSTQMAYLREILSEQIKRAFAHGKKHGEQCEVSDADALRTAEKFLSALPRLREILATDIDAAYEGDPAAACKDEIVFSYPSVYAVMIYRLAHELQKLRVPLIPRIMTEYAHQRTGIDIHPSTVIGEAFFIDHGTGVVIGGTAVIGDRVKLYQSVTLGAFSFPKDSSGKLIRDTKRHPTIEDDVVIYSGATVLGGETVIGRGSMIGGNVWLTQSVPPFTKVYQDTPKLRIVSPVGVEKV